MVDHTLCNICGSEVDVHARFCGICGTEVSLALPGLRLGSALAWRGNLGKLGWWERPDEGFRPLIARLIEAGTLPASDSQLEPWIMFSNGAFENWKLCAMRQTDDRSWLLWQPDTAVLATRCRILTLGLTAGEVNAVWYKDLRVADRDRYQTIAHIVLADDRGTELRLGMPYAGERSVELFGSLQPPGHVTIPRSDSVFPEAVPYSVDFHEVVALFLTAITAVSHT